jgi:F-type H+-transporting ATPase subunit epsilon
MLLETPATRITAPGTSGSFQVLPRHVDVVWSLQSGILQINTTESEVYFAIDRGVLVKEGDVVHVSCYEAIKGDSLEALHSMISERFTEIDDQERKTRQVLLNMEMNTKLKLKQLEQ